MVKSHLEVAYVRLFTTPDGEVVLNDLKERFYAPVLAEKGSSTTDIITKAAQHDLIAVILKKIGEQDDI